MHLVGNDGFRLVLGLELKLSLETGSEVTGSQVRSGINFNNFSKIFIDLFQHLQVLMYNAALLLFSQ